MDLTPALKKQIEDIGTVDVVIGILTKNVETTVLHVLNIVTEGVLENLSRYETLIVISDGFSTDRTAEIAGLFNIEPLKKIVVEQMGEPGKGNGIRTVLEIASHLNARAVGLVDGDLLSIRPGWIQELIEPVLYGRSDLVVPFYIRDRFDGVITNNLAYPFTRSFYGIEVRQPIGGEYGLSKRLIEILKDHPLFPHHFGIDIFITTVAGAENQRIREAMLGLKLHESTTKYLDPESSLIPMFRQVVGTMFDLAVYYREKGFKKKQILDAEFADYHGPTPVPVSVDRKKLVGLVAGHYSSFKEIYKKVFPKDISKQLRGLGEGNINFNSDLWARCVWHMFAAYAGEKDQQLIDALRVLWLARFISYYDECKNLDIFHSENVVRGQEKVFEKKLSGLKGKIFKIRT